jgi:hypothetical protein
MSNDSKSNVLTRTPYFVFRPPKTDEERKAMVTDGVCLFLHVTPPYHEKYNLKHDPEIVFEIGYRVEDELADELKNPDVLAVVHQYFKRNPGTEETIEIEIANLLKNPELRETKK